MKIIRSLQVPYPIPLAIGSLVVLPLLGILAVGQPIGRYLEFPPHTHYVVHAGFAWPAWIGLALLILFAILPFIMRVIISNASLTRNPKSPPPREARGKPEGLPRHWRGRHPPYAFITNVLSRWRPASLPAIFRPYTRQSEAPPLSTSLLPSNAFHFPIWGWLGLAFGIGAWILAWSRFVWFAPLQPFTFSPLWFAYIITVNALTWRRTGQCMLTHRTRYLLLLFVASAAFWWLFEYLNRFVQNWYYVGVNGLTPLEYLLIATLPFSTVLPAVMGTCDLLATYPRIYTGLNRFLPLSRVPSRLVAAIVLILSALGLAGIGLWPDYLFPLLWLAPLGILVSIQSLAGRATLFADCARGDWRRIALLALAALICGFFWEMWNFYSLAKWVYAVPFVNRFHIFEMPVLGYAGYLPFGLECALIADLVANGFKLRTP